MTFSLSKLSQKKIESYLGILVRIDMQSKMFSMVIFGILSMT